MDAELRLILKEVSRSFYLSLQWLPVPMRGAASLAYLLARASDTIADTTGLMPTQRAEQLHDYQEFMQGRSSRLPHAQVLADSSPGEQALLGQLVRLRQVLERMPVDQQGLIDAVLAEIISGQRLDVQRFAQADASNPVCLPDAIALEDYCDRVAGSVGEFWTRLADCTLDANWSATAVSDLVVLGRRYGQGLQLVNILRDMPTDRAMGRCYLPGAGGLAEADLLLLHAQWRQRAECMVGAGLDYASALRSRRLRVATVLPALMGLETLARLRNVSWERLHQRVKISRLAVWHCLAEALLF